jgi:tRNA1(Val) A37 N6-methylase TrmN6
VCDELGRAPCLVLTEARKDGGVSAYVTPPFILREGKMTTPDFDYLLENGEFPRKYVSIFP